MIREVFKDPDAGKSLIFLEEEIPEACKVFCIERKWNVYTVEGIDWNRDLSPWPAGKVFKKGEDFSGGGEAFLKRLLEETKEIPAQKYLAGVSLAGLFALYAATRSDCFSGILSISGSLWYPGLREYLSEQPFYAEAVYLSLGEQEGKSRNPVLTRVEEETAACAAILKEKGVHVKREMNPGGHFADGEERLLKALRWLTKSGM